MSSAELKPCKCGYSGVLSGMWHNGYVSLDCPKCNHQAQSFTMRGLADQWNQSVCGKEAAMSNEVKRYDQGRIGMRLDENGPWVAWDDYATLEAENARLAEDVKKWKALAEGVELLGKIDKSSEDRRAQLAAIQGGR